MACPFARQQTALWCKCTCLGYALLWRHSSCYGYHHANRLAKADIQQSSHRAQLLLPSLARDWLSRACDGMHKNFINATSEAHFVCPPAEQTSEQKNLQVDYKIPQASDIRPFPVNIMSTPGAISFNWIVTKETLLLEFLGRGLERWISD